MSWKLEAYMVEYNRVHAAGNPQLQISSYVKSDEPQPVKVLCLLLDGALSGGKVHCRRVGMWISGVQRSSCPKNLLRKKK